MDPSAIDPSVTAAIISTVSAWVWDAVGKDLAAEQTEKFGWRKAAQTYAKELHQQHSTVRILGKPDPVGLDEVFTDVYILRGSSGSRRFAIHKLREREFDRFDRYLDRSRQKRVAGLELVKAGRNLFILGKPGAGKTTFLHHVVLETLDGEIPRRPIFISLKRWSTSEHTELIPYLVEQFDICGFPDAAPFVEQLLKQGKAIVLFDGLDEVNIEHNQRRTLVRLLQDFAHQYNKSQVLLTCRIAASEYMFEGFSDVEVADFERDQIHAFAKKWFNYEAKEDNETRIAFIKALYDDENQSIRERCSSPLLLTMLCLAYEETGYFPKRRAELYEDATEILLRKWDAKRNIRRDKIYHDLSHKRRQQLLSHVAIRTFEAGDYFIERRTLEQHIEEYLTPLAGDEGPDANAVLRAIAAQHGFLVERAQDIYSFSHLTFQEYFAAKYVADNEARGAATRLAHQHLTDNRWREVYLLTASLLYDADSFFMEMRGGIAGLLRDDEQMVQLLQWADRRAHAANVPDERRAAVRLTYINLALDRDRELTIANALVLALDCALSHALDHDPAIENDRSRARERSLAIERAREVNLTIDHGAFGYRLDSDYALLYAWQMAAIFAAVRDWDDVARKLGTQKSLTMSQVFIQQVWYGQPIVR